MKSPALISSSIALAVASISLGCSGTRSASPYHPGPAAGKAVGSGVGVVVGNTAGAVTGFGEGVVTGTASAFDSRHRVVRKWQTEVTADGRTVRVPVDVLVDEHGRPVDMPPPKQ